MKKILALLFALVMVFAFSACGDDTSSDVEETEAVVEETEATAEAITLEYGVKGEYGTEMKLENDGDVKEYIAYHVPAGTYLATNKGEYMAQVTVYKDGTETNEDGIEEQIMSDQKPLMLDVGASDTLVVNEGEYIEISDNEIIELQLQ